MPQPPHSIQPSDEHTRQGSPPGSAERPRHSKHCRSSSADRSVNGQFHGRRSSDLSVGADVAFDADPKFLTCLVLLASSSVPTPPPSTYDDYLSEGRHDGGYYTGKAGV